MTEECPKSFYWCDATCGATRSNEKRCDITNKKCEEDYKTPMRCSIFRINYGGKE